MGLPSSHHSVKVLRRAIAYHYYCRQRHATTYDGDIANAMTVIPAEFALLRLQNDKFHHQKAGLDICTFHDYQPYITSAQARLFRRRRSSSDAATASPTAPFPLSLAARLGAAGHSYFIIASADMRETFAARGQYRVSKCATSEIPYRWHFTQYWPASRSATARRSRYEHFRPLRPPSASHAPRHDERQR